ncbi:MAG TPA: glycerophosphodiester phosphodiesterase family protein, partial [Burkholderiales bacterium]|nr:glycerophosphodiester phosphodiesterase family protein [Burkholderiales bacterium]
MIDVQGHRGARGYRPENTLPSFARALELGVTTLELDVGVTRDGVVVIHHDRGLNPDLARGPDGQWVSRAVPIHSLAYAELQRYDVGRLRPGSD